MRKHGVVLCLVCVVVMVFHAMQVTADEIPFGGKKEFVIGEETWRVIFERKQNRVCFVNLQKVDERQIVSSKPISFDYVREERYEHIGNATLTIFYVAKGIIVLVDGREM